MKNLLSKSILAVICLSCLTIWISCNESIKVDAVYITAAEKTPLTSFSATNNNDELGITISSSLVANSDIEGELMIDNSLVESYNKNHGESYNYYDKNSNGFEEGNIDDSTNGQVIDVDYKEVDK